MAGIPEHALFDGYRVEDVRPHVAVEHELRHLRDALHTAASWAEIADKPALADVLRSHRDDVARDLAGLSARRDGS